MPKAEQTRRMLALWADAAFWAISLRRDGLTTFLRVPPGTTWHLVQGQVVTDFTQYPSQHSDNPFINNYVHRGKVDEVIYRDVFYWVMYIYSHGLILA